VIGLHELEDVFITKVELHHVNALDFGSETLSG
jgi:hypothetical protein